MLDAAFREIAGLVSEAVGGPYQAAKLTYPGVPVKDDGGSIITPATPYDVACRAQIDVAIEAMRQADGFMAEDVRILIIDPATLDRTPVLTVTDGSLAGKVYSLISVTRDTLGFGWECRGRAA